MPVEAAPPGADGAIARLLATAAAVPGRTALLDGAVRLTFAEVADRVARGAGAVLSGFAGPPPAGTVVPVLVHRDAHAAVDVLAVHHAGLAAAPFDAGLAPAVLQDLWHRSGRPPVVLARDPAVAAVLPGATIVDPGSGDAVAVQPVTPDALAVVLFTSGSTGRPKGVMYDERLVAAAVDRWDDPVLSGPPGATAGLLFPFHFWGGYQRILSLVTGRPLVVIDPTGLDADAILERLERDGVEVTGLVPTMVPVLAAAAQRSGRRLRRIRTVTLGGETVTWQHVAQVRSFVAPDATLSNGYGGSESPLGALRFEIPPDRPIASGRLPLGSPVAPDRVRLEPVDAGPDSPLEVVVCGPVALGYLGDPDLTATAFRPLPDGTPCWRTGDVVEVAADGELHPVGRLDELTKINGRLVAPTQTQTALLTVTGVREAAVVTRTVADRTRLVAHVVVSDDTTPTALRAALRAALPAHQLPHVVVRHDRLPTTSTTKVDRRALDATPLVPWRTAEPVPPRTPTEATVLPLVVEVLGVPIGVTDDVWEYGLDSIGAVELAVALRDAGLDVAVDLLVEHPTVAGLAAHVDRSTAPPSAVVLLNAAASRPPVWCVPGGGGTSIVYRSLANALAPDQPVAVVEPRGYRTPGRPRLRIRSAAADVVAEIERSTPVGPVVVVGYSVGVVVAFTACGILAERGWTPRLVAIDAGPVGGRPRRRRPGPVGRLHHRANLLRKDLRGIRRWITGRTEPERTDADSHFVTYARWAIRFHRPDAPTFPTLLVRRRAGVGGIWPVPPDRVVETGGDHVTILHPPHVAAVAAAVRDEVTAADA